MYNYDNFGNGYYNTGTNGKIGTLYNTASLQTAINTFLGNSYCNINNNNDRLVRCALAHPWDTPSVDPLYMRFKVPFNPTYSLGNIAWSILTAYASNVSVTGTIAPTGVTSSNAVVYANFTTTNINLFMSEGTVSGSFTPAANKYFVSMGFLNNSLFPLQVEFIRQTYMLIISSAYGIQVATSPQHPPAANGGAHRLFLTSGTAQYNITCLNPSEQTSEVKATDFFVRDNSNVLGNVKNVVKISDNTLSVGTFHTIQENIDGNTDEKLWLCVAEWGNDRLSMRVKQ